MSFGGSTPTPALTALMCDGMGWFTRADFKRAILLYDRILYLVPSTTVRFRDADGSPKHLVLPQTPGLGFEFHHFQPDTALSQAIWNASASDAARPGFTSVIETIPASDRIYTWRIVNADADLGAGASLALPAGQEAFAHALLLNKFLLAAGDFDAVPITGKPYIHALIGDKCRHVHPVSGASIHPVALRLVASIIPNEELERRDASAILEYKQKNRLLFERFGYTLRSLVQQVSATPDTPAFERELSTLFATEVWREKTAIETELREAWAGFFRSAVKSAAAGAVTLGLTPFLSLGTVSLGAVLAGAAAAAPWATAELIALLEKRQQARRHGLYYLMNF